MFKIKTLPVFLHFIGLHGALCDEDGQGGDGTGVDGGKAEEREEANGHGGATV